MCVKIDKRFVAVALATLFLAGTARAATVTFTNAAAFQAALGTFTVHDFDNIPGVPGAPGVGGTPLDQEIPGIDFDNSKVTFGDSGGTYNSPLNVVLNADLGSPIVFTFATPVFGVGLFNTSLVDAERFEVFDASDNLLGSIDLPHAFINFGGFTSTVGIAKGVVTPISPTNGSIYIDDLTVGAAAVPEPSTLLLLGTGLVGLVGYGRRQKRKG